MWKIDPNIFIKGIGKERVSTTVKLLDCDRQSAKTADYNRRTQKRDRPEHSSFQRRQDNSSAAKSTQRRDTDIYARVT